MKVEIWSDYACPFCYIGKRRFESALQQFANADQVEVIYRSFELDPNAPKDTAEDMNTMLAKKYGMSIEQAKANGKQVEQQAASVGLEYHLDSMILTNTLQAHRLTHYAAAQGKEAEVVEALYKAYFTDSLHLGEPTVLAEIAKQAGLDYDATLEMLSSDEYTNEVRADERDAAILGVRGVPFFVLDRKYGVSGAQPVEMFLEAMNKAWNEAHPLTVMNTDNGSGGVCTDGACSMDGK